MIKTSLTLKDHFVAAHFYHQPKWSAEQNLKVFGKCYSDHGHGHNYEWQATFQTPQSPLETLQGHMKAVSELLDHHHLNFKIPEFQNTIPTTENIAQFLLKKLQERCPNEGLSSIKLFEMKDLWVEIEL